MNIYSWIEYVEKVVTSPFLGLQGQWNFGEGYSTHIILDTFYREWRNGLNYVFDQLFTIGLFKNTV